MAVTDQALFEQIARLSVGRKQELAALCFVENVNKALDPLRMNISKVAAGAIWADARLPSEYNYEHIEGVINLPLNEIRNLAGKLDASKEYVVYCQTGRRSSTAAFILAQCGLKAVVLAGGTRNQK